MSRPVDHGRTNLLRAYQALKFCSWVLLLLIAVFLLILPAAFSWLVETGNYNHWTSRWTEPVEFMQSLLMHIVTFGWMFFLGGCLASFLNVVAWRVPRGKPITGSSYCPNCITPLSFRDNIPFFGWLKNAGRCRQCKSPISIRYFVAEVVLGVIFLALSAMVLLTRCGNWPLIEPVRSVGLELLLFSPNWEVISVLAWQLTLVCFLFVFMLIESDRLSVPTNLVVLAVIFACGVSYFHRDVLLVSWQHPFDLTSVEDSATQNWVYTLVIGGLVGIVVGQLTRWATATPQSSESVQPIGLFLVGLFLGWQAVLSVGALTLLIFLFLWVLVKQVKTLSVVTAGACLLTATTTHLLFWSFLQP